MGRSEMTGHSILVRIQNDINCFENSSCKLLWLNNPQSHAGHGTCVASWNSYGVWLVGPTSNQTPKCFWNCVL